MIVFSNNFIAKFKNKNSLDKKPMTDEVGLKEAISKIQMRLLFVFFYKQGSIRLLILH